MSYGVRFAIGILAFIVIFIGGILFVASIMDDAKDDDQTSSFDDWKNRITYNVHEQYPTAGYITVKIDVYKSNCVANGTFIYNDDTYKFIFEYTKYGDTWYLTSRSTYKAYS